MSGPANTSKLGNSSIDPAAILLQQQLAGAPAAAPPSGGYTGGPIGGAPGAAPVTDVATRQQPPPEFQFGCHYTFIYIPV